MLILRIFIFFVAYQQIPSGWRNYRCGGESRHRLLNVDGPSRATELLPRPIKIDPTQTTNILTACRHRCVTLPSSQITHLTISSQKSFRTRNPRWLSQRPCKYSPCQSNRRILYSPVKDVRMSLAKQSRCNWRKITMRWRWKPELSVSSVPSLIPLSWSSE